MGSAKLQKAHRQRDGKKVTAKRAPAKRVRAAAVRREPKPESAGVIAYRSTRGVDDYIRQVARATPLQLVEIERQGVLGSFIKDLSKRMEIPSSRIFTILGVPKATAEKKAAAGERVEGSGGQAAIGMVRLVGIAQEIVADSTAREARTFDATKWLGQWIERPQSALGGRRPAELLDTPTGTELVARLLGSIESGAYQ
jgi:putative toxin-antitoxin system antitoxin component (TIGR02293 family)